MNEWINKSINQSVKSFRTSSARPTSHTHTHIQHRILGIDEDDEREEEDEKLVLLLQIDVPHVESHAQLTWRRKQGGKLQATQIETNKRHATCIAWCDMHQVMRHASRGSLQNYKALQFYLWQCWFVSKSRHLSMAPELQKCHKGTRECSSLAEKISFQLLPQCVWWQATVTGRRWQNIPYCRPVCVKHHRCLTVWHHEKHSARVSAPIISIGTHFISHISVHMTTSERMMLQHSHYNFCFLP